MARPKSDDKRKAILEAATRVIAAQGLGAPTAVIAKEAGISNGSLFTYFETKSVLLNQLYLELKTESAAATLNGLPANGDLRSQFLHMCRHWLSWAAAFPAKRRALAHLGVSDDITPQTRQTGHQIMAGIGKLLERCRETGAMRDAPLKLVVALMNAMAEATIDFMIEDPANADKHCLTAFEAMWRMIA